MHITQNTDAENCWLTPTANLWSKTQRRYQMDAHRGDGQGKLLALSSLSESDFRACWKSPDVHFPCLVLHSHPQERWSVVQVIYGEEHFALKSLLFVQMRSHALFLFPVCCVDEARRMRRDFPRAEFPMWMAALCAPSLGWWLCAGADLECLCTSQWDQVKPRPAFDPRLSTKKGSQDNYRNIQVIIVPLLFWCREL